MQLEILAENGIIVYVDEQGKFTLEKRSSKKNNLKIEPIKFDTFQEVINEIEIILNKPKEWNAIVRFNRGLGIEYKNIYNITGDSLEDAKIIAKQQAEKLLGDSIIEIKVIPVLRTK